jgi:hypothetical protein
MANNTDIKSWGQSPDVGNGDAIVKTAYIVFNSAIKPIEYFIFAGWELSDSRFKTEKLLNTIMLAEAKRQNHKILISYSNW